MRSLTLSVVVVVLAAICGLAAAGQHAYRMPKHFQPRQHHPHHQQQQQHQQYQQQLKAVVEGQTSATSSSFMATKNTDTPKTVEAPMKQASGSMEKTTMKPMEKHVVKKHVEKPTVKYVIMKHTEKQEKLHQEHSSSFEDHHEPEDHVHDYHSHPKYKFDYGVKDAKSGDDKNHWEERDGDKVKGKFERLNLNYLQ